MIGNCGAAFRMENVRSVISGKKPVPLPLSREWVAGLLPYKGVSLPVINPVMIPGFVSFSGGELLEFVVVLDYMDYITGFQVSSVDVITDNSITLLDFDSQCVLPFNRRYAEGVLKAGDALYCLLNIKELHGSIDIA